MSEESLRDRARRWLLEGLDREPTAEELESVECIATGRMPFDLHPELTE